MKILVIFFILFLFYSFTLKEEESFSYKQTQTSKITNCKSATRVLTDGSGPSLVCDSYY